MAKEDDRGVSFHFSRDNIYSVDGNPTAEILFGRVTCFFFQLLLLILLWAAMLFARAEEGNFIDNISIHISALVYDMMLLPPRQERLHLQKKKTSFQWP
jgi:hypothetical protein